MCDIKFKNYKDFFLDLSVKFNMAFPKTAFDIKKFKTCYNEMSFKISGKDRLFVLPSMQYDKFINDVGIDHYIKSIKKLPFLKHRPSNFKSFTNIYSEQIFEISKKNFKYSKLMINQWVKYKKELIKMNSTFNSCYYFDIENFYLSIYIHFIKGLPLPNIDEFYNSKLNYSNFDKKINSDIKNFHDKFLEHIVFARETKGIPIGNGISDFFAEQYLLLIEYFLYQETVDDNYKVVRYRDDIFVFSNDHETLNKVYITLTKLLLSFKLFFNNSKTNKALNNNDLIKLVCEKTYINIDKFKESIQDLPLLEQIQKMLVHNTKTNKINKYLHDLALNANKYTIEQLFTSMKNFIVESETNPYPWVVAIYDKIDSTDKVLSFYNLFKDCIKLYKTDVDLIWIATFFKKYKFEQGLNEAFSLMNKSIRKMFDNFIDENNYDKIDLINDVDAFYYE